MTDDVLSLIERAQSGDEAAENAVISRYKNLVEFLSRPYFLTGADDEDIHQIGMIGLMRAVRSFDTQSGRNFEPYASSCIRNAILDGVREANTSKNRALNDSASLISEDDGLSLIESIPADASFNPEEQYLAKEAEQAFFDALSSALGEQDLAIIKLYLSSMPYKEISEQLGVTAKKVDNTIYSVKKRLQKLLKDRL